MKSPGSAAYVVVLALTIAVGGLAATRNQATPTAAELLALLPDGATKRQFIIDCTGCHTFHAGIAYPGGVKRTEQQWRDAITRMTGFAGPHSNFPVISVHAADSTARWLAAHLPATMPSAQPRNASPEVTEYLLPAPQDLPHDVAVMKDGRVLITGMFTHRMYVLDPAAGAFETVSIPVERANPRAVELDADGNWYVALGGPRAVAMFDAVTRTWQTHTVGVYPHSVAVDSSGNAWYNGHFTVNPEQIGRIDTNGNTRTFEVPAHPVLADVAGGPIPYELRAARDGGIWGSELQGNRVFRFDPRTESFKTWLLPTSHAGPRRLDVDARGLVWIPAYGAGSLFLLDPAADSIAEIALPIANSAPYIVRVDNARGSVWIATGAADAVFRYQPATKKFTTYTLPSAGALVRHMAIDPASGDVWLAYGASPGIPARVARLSSQ